MDFFSITQFTAIDCNVKACSIEYQSVTSSKIFFFVFQHFHDFFLQISVEHDEKPPHTKFDMNRFMVAQDMAA